VGEVTELKPLSSRPDRGMVKIKYALVNQHDEPVTIYILTHFFKRRPEAA
jgi:acyl dehydratase